MTINYNEWNNVTYQILYGEKNISLSIAHIDNIISFDKIEIE